MTTPKNVDYLDEKDFKELLKYLDIQPKYINGKVVETYSIYRNGKLYGFIGKKAFEYRIEQ